MATATRAVITNTWTSPDGVTYSALCNDGTTADYYAYFPGSVTSDWLHIVLDAGGAAWHVTNDANDPYDMATRPTGLKSSSGAASTVDLTADKGGALSDDSGDNPDLYDAAQVLFEYRSSDFFTGLGTAQWRLNGSPTTWYFYGYANLRAGLAQILDLAAAADYTKLLIGGRSAGAYGVLYNWPWIYDMATARGWTVKGYSDGAAPIDYYAINGWREFFSTETYDQTYLWRSPLTRFSQYNIPRPSDIESVTNTWTLAQAQAFLVFMSQTDTAALVYSGLDLAALSAAEKLFGAEFGEQARKHLLNARAGLNIYAPWYVNITGDWETAHVLTGATYYNSTALIPGLTPQQALSLFIAGTAVYCIEPEGEPFP